MKNRTFNTRGPVDPARHYTVPRKLELSRLIEHIKEGRYVVIFAPRQTGKTTFFRWALTQLADEDARYFPIQLDFQTLKNLSIDKFYEGVRIRIHEAIENEFLRYQRRVPAKFQDFLRAYPLIDHSSFRQFLIELAVYLEPRKIVMIIDEFDGIPSAALSDFLHTLREIYHSPPQNRTLHSVGIVGVKSISQLNYDRSISPFNIQDDFSLPNFTLDQVHTLLAQYVEERGHMFEAGIIANMHRQTAGQPFLVNRLAQILTAELNIPTQERIGQAHFEQAYKTILHEPSTHILHLTNNIRKNRQFEQLLMRIALRERPVAFNYDNEIISELSTYGVLVPDEDWNCQIQNPIYQYRIVQTFQPLINGLEDDFLPEDTASGFYDYLDTDGEMNIRLLLANFRDFIKRAGYRILAVPDTPQEFIGQYLLFGYLEQFVRQVRGFMYLEVPSGRGRMDLIILHNHQKYIIETKLWEGKVLYQKGKQQLATYLDIEGCTEGYYVVFDHRAKPESRDEVAQIEGKTVVSFVIPVVQKRPSAT